MSFLKRVAFWQTRIGSKTTDHVPTTFETFITASICDSEAMASARSRILLQKEQQMRSHAALIHQIPQLPYSAPLSITAEKPLQGPVPHQLLPHSPSQTSHIARYSHTSGRCYTKHRKSLGPLSCSGSSMGIGNIFGCTKCRSNLDTSRSTRF